MVSLMEAGYLAIAFVVYVVITSVGGAVLTGVQNGQFTTANNASCTLALAQGGQASCMSVAWNATGYGLTGILNLSQQSGTIGTILGAVVMIGLLMGAFYIKGKMDE